MEANSPTSVAFITTAMHTGGAERQLSALILKLQQTRFRPILICLKDLGRFGDELVSLGITAYSNLSRRGTDPRLLTRIAGILVHEDVQIACTVGTGGDRSFWGRLAAKAAGVSAIVSCPHSMGAPDKHELSNRLLTPITDAFVAVAEAQKQYLIDEVRIPADKIQVIYNGLDCDRFRPGSRSVTLLRELGVELDAPVAGIVAMLRPEKNIDLFLDAAAATGELVPNARFLIVGDGPQRASLETKARRLGIAKRMLFTGSRTDVEELLRLMDVFVLSSKSEAFPMSILEAAATGKPVVATDVGAIREMIRPDETGLLVPSGDARGLAESLSRLLANPEEAKLMGLAARHYVSAQFGIDVMVQGYQDLFSRLLDVDTSSSPLSHSKRYWTSDPTRFSRCKPELAANCTD